MLILAMCLLSRFLIFSKKITCCSCESGLLAINEVENYVCEESPVPLARADSIAEEGEETQTEDTFLKPAGDNCGAMK